MTKQTAWRIILVIGGIGVIGFAVCMIYGLQGLAHSRLW